MHSTDKSSKLEKRSSEKQTLVKELKELLSSCEGQRVPVATVLARYYQHFGRLLKIGDYGARRLEDLVDGLPSLQVGVTWLALRAGRMNQILYCYPNWARSAIASDKKMVFSVPILNKFLLPIWLLNSLVFVCLWTSTAS